MANKIINASLQEISGGSALINQPIKRSNLPSENLPSEDDHAEFSMLLENLQKLSMAKDLETIMFIVRKAARKLTGADGATFVLRDDDKCFYADEDAIAPLWKGKRFPMKMCISGWVMEHAESVVIEDIYADPRIPADAYRPTFVKSLAMVPIRTASPVGAIGTYWAEKYRPTEKQLNLLKALADSTSIAMKNINLQSKLEEGSKENSAQLEITKQLMESNKQLANTLAELNHRNEEMQWLKELSSKLQTCLHIEEAYQLIAQYAEKLLPETSGNFYIMHPSRNYLESMLSFGKIPFQEKIIKPNECLGLRRGLAYKVDDPQKELICAHFNNDEHKQPYACIPLFAQSDVIGMLCLKSEIDSNTEENMSKKNNDDILASMLSEQIAIGISNITLRETLRNQSLHDALTGLYNRRYLEETLEREISRCARKSAPLTVLMLDIDHFKQFNDKFGHEAGDVVLQAFGNVLRQFVRKADIACRYGGEEFVFIMPETDEETALERTKSLHEHVSKLYLRYGGNALTQVTISIGLSTYPLHGSNMHDLISAADTALYQAKNSGRNKTVVYKK